jgi:hypothetical protein
LGLDPIDDGASNKSPEHRLAGIGQQKTEEGRFRRVLAIRGRRTIRHARPAPIAMVAAGFDAARVFISAHISWTPADSFFCAFSRNWKIILRFFGIGAAPRPPHQSTTVRSHDPLVWPRMVCTRCRDAQPNWKKQLPGETLTGPDGMNDPLAMHHTAV